MLRDPEEAQDVAQETMLRFWRAGGLEDPQHAAAWIYRTATHLAVDRLRRQKRAPFTASASADAQVQGPDARLLMADLLRSLAAQIPSEQLELAFLDRVDGLTQAESARVLGLSERTVRRRLQELDERLTAVRDEVRA